MKFHLYLNYTGSVLLTSKALAIQGNPFDVSFHCGVLAGILRMEEAPPPPPLLQQPKPSSRRWFLCLENASLSRYHTVLSSLSPCSKATVLSKQKEKNVLFPNSESCSITKAQSSQSCVLNLASPSENQLQRATRGSSLFQGQTLLWRLKSKRILVFFPPPR